MASFYGRELAGNRTASGERFDPARLTAAHRTLPLGSQVRVTNPANGQSVIVTVNDRGPFHSNRLIDLSKAAADKIGISRAGSGKVELAVLEDD
ncbi:septal ring lytic transglycosylase RlpA family lipoprotein [Sphingomonas sp. IC081]|nr:septal ring lytic transglycosylase RlpA family lipoprotein [Sphingomonas sp. IC081]QSR15808.1 septal ring lytic transglycosylase RlpA family lipoprotein [Novosphingobium sp. KA1]